MKELDLTDLHPVEKGSLSPDDSSLEENPVSA
jgi:hypothetical protein